MDIDDKKIQRRVYTLSPELVERIISFQQTKGYPSEVEAVRRLLEEALSYRDSADDIVLRFLEKLKQHNLPSDVAKDVLVGHPLVTSISFIDDTVQFKLKNGREFIVKPYGTAFERDENGELEKFEPIPF